MAKLEDYLNQTSMKIKNWKVDKLNVNRKIKIKIKVKTNAKI